MKHIKLYCLLVIFICIGTNASFAAAADRDYPIGNGEYALTTYHIGINVNQDNSLDITEDITAYFHQSKHGIIRKIPLRNKVERLDGTHSFNRAKITDIKVNEPHAISTGDGCRVIKIGDADKTLTGLKRYTIQYTYDLGKDPGKDYDELYFNLIGNKWDTTISNVSFAITMPKEFDASKLGFSHGTVGSTDSSDITYKVQGNVITGKYSGILRDEEAMTVRLELPEGYFVGAGNNWDLALILTFFIPIITVLLLVILCALYRRITRPVETVEFYPPDKLSSAEVGLIYTGDFTNIELVSILITLANKGYIKLFSESKSYLIQKVKNYTGKVKHEQKFMRGLFGIMDTITEGNRHLINYYLLSGIKSDFKSSENYGKFFDLKADKKRIMLIGFLWIVMISVLILISLRPAYEYHDAIFPVIMTPIFTIITFFTIITPIFCSFSLFKSRLVTLILGVAVGLSVGGVFFIPPIIADPLYIAAFIVGYACNAIILRHIKLIPRKRTPYGRDLLGKINGFRRFLMHAEKEKLELLVAENPSYFYHILPYTYVLGVSTKWIKRFKELTMSPPDWYGNSGSYDSEDLYLFMRRTMNSLGSALTKPPSSGSSSSSSSSGSGGGSSGGGSGGGGGSSW